MERARQIALVNEFQRWSWSLKHVISEGRCSNATWPLSSCACGRVFQHFVGREDGKAERRVRICLAHG